MIRDLRTDTPDPALRADVCIVGAGAAGITLAAELVHLGRSVLLLEGGPALPEPDAADTCTAVGRAHRGLADGRARGLGGTTSLWGGQILPLGALDFAERPWVAGSGWPIARSVLEPFYRRALELEGLGTALAPDDAVWDRLGLLTRPDFPGLRSYLSRWCPEPNFARLHRALLERHPRLTVWLHAHAVELPGRHEAAEGVRCRTRSGQEAVFHADQYVFALGAVESARFFLQARPGSLPWNRSGLLGRHFQDHIDSDAATVMPRPGHALSQLFDTIYLAGHKYTPKLALSDTAQREGELLNCGATIYPAPGSAAEAAQSAQIKRTAQHLAHGRLRAVGAGDLWQCAVQAPRLARQAWRYAVGHRAWNPPGTVFRLRVHCEQEPLSASSITLGGGRDAFGLLRARLQWHIAPRELHTIRAFVASAVPALAALAEVTPDPGLLAGDAFLDRCEDSFHHMGGMRMHPSAQHGVVDTDLKLHGMCNVYVCSSAAFPTSGFSNPTHTLLALAVRLAAHLDKEAAQPVQAGQAAHPRTVLSDAEPTLAIP